MRTELILSRRSPIATRMLLPKAGSVVALALSGVALLMLAFAPLGWRAGWWHYRFALDWLLPISSVVATIAAILAATTLALGRSELGLRRLAMACVALVLGAAVACVLLQYRMTRNSLPRIHDITTDTDNPPLFAAALPARRAESSNTADYGGPRLAKLQRTAYPDIAPLATTLPVPTAFALALEVASKMPGWTIVASDPGAGRIEASQTSRWFGFTDDVAIRVSADGSGSRIDIRSTSRHGRSDYGVNAARIRAYMDALRRRAAASKAG
jgi:uncharacterized protein (DUF1499 family)